jgi:hypothetical protein
MAILMRTGKRRSAEVIILFGMNILTLAGFVVMDGNVEISGRDLR